MDGHFGVACLLMGIKENIYIWVQTPGFNHTAISAAEIMETIEIDWLFGVF
jgi:hypothetical protein